MRVLVAVAALVKRNAEVLGLSVRTIRMALRALHLGMQPSQRITRLRVVELAGIDRLPVFEVVTLLAIRPQPSFVLIFVASAARGRQAKIRPVEIFDLDSRAIRRRDVGRIVALGTGHAGMFAFERISRLPVIEGLDVPLD